MFKYILYVIRMYSSIIVSFCFRLDAFVVVPLRKISPTSAKKVLSNRLCQDILTVMVKSSTSLPTKTLSLHLLRMKAVRALVSEKSTGGAEEACKAIEQAAAFVETPEMQRDELAWWVFEVASNLTEAVSASIRDKEPLRKVLAKMAECLSNRILGNRFPKEQRLLKSLAILFHFLETTLEVSSDSCQVEGCLSQMQRVAMKASAGAPECNLFLGYVHHARFRLSYQQHHWRVRYEMKKKSAAGEERSREEEQRDEVLAVGDVNPYVMEGMRKEQEEEMMEQLLQSVHCMEKVPTSSALQNLLPWSQIVKKRIMRVVSTAADFLALIGLVSHSEKASACLLRLSRTVGYTHCELLALANLVRLGSSECAYGDETTKAMNKSDAEVGQLHLCAAVAAKDLHRSEFDRADRMCELMLRRLDAKRDLNSVVLKADVYRLKALLAAARKTDGKKGPIELSSEAFTQSSMALNRARADYLRRPPSSAKQESSSPSGIRPFWADLEALSGLFSASRIHGEVLEARLDLFAQVGMPKEMRLYSKLGMQFSQEAALPLRCVAQGFVILLYINPFFNYCINLCPSLRTANTLLIMASVDLLCEEYDQAEVKIDGAKYILGSSVLYEEATTTRVGRGNEVRHISN